MPMPPMRELIARSGPRIVTPRLMVVSHALLLGAAACCLIPIALAGVILLAPSLRVGLWLVALIPYVIGLGLFIGWAILNIIALAMLLFRSNAMLADQLDAQSVQDEALITLLTGSGTRDELQALGRRIVFEIRLNERFPTTVAIVGGLGAAITTTAAALPGAPIPLGDTLKVVVPALLLGAAIASALHHSFANRLLRLSFAIDQAERILASDDDGGSEQTRHGQSA